MTIPERIKLIRKSQKMTQRDFAKKIGISKSSIQFYETGKAIPNVEVFEKIYKIFNVNPAWLLTGEGNPFNTDKPTPEYTPYEMLLAEILHRIGYYEHDFTPEQLATLINLVEKEVKVTLWDLQNKIFALIRKWKK